MGSEFRVLLVEDDGEFAALVERLLSKSDRYRFEIQKADTLNKTLDREDVGSFDLVLLDLGLPDSEGLETLIRFRERVATVPIVVLSSWESEEFAATAIGAGAQDYLFKSEISPGLLKRTVVHTLERHRRMAQIAAERGASEEALRRLNRALRIASAANREMGRAVGEQELLDRTCRIIVEQGGYRMSWIGWAQPDEEKSVRPVAQAGESMGYLEDVRISWADDEHGREPVGLAIRLGAPQAVRDIRADSAIAPWQEEAIKRGYLAVIAIPVISRGTTVGAIVIYSDQTEIFDAEEIALLRDLADNLDHGLESLRARAERERAEGELLRSQRALAAERERRDAILDALPASVALLDGEGTIVEVNAAWRTFADANGFQGLRHGVGVSYLAVCDAATGESSEGAAAAAASGIRSVLRGERDVFTLEYPCHCAREKRWFQMTVNPTLPGRDVGAVVMHLNITERVENERERTRLITVIEQTADSVVILDLDGAIRYVNRAFEESIGYSRDEVLGRTEHFMNSGVHPEEFFIDMWRRVRRGETWKSRVTNRRKNGETIQEDVTLTPIRDGAERGIVGFVEIKRDVTQQVAQELQQRQQQRLESIGTLAGGVAHEINNPITAIMNYGQLIADQLPPSDRNKEFALEIVAESERIAGIVNNLLTFSRQDLQSQSQARVADIVSAALSLTRAVLRRDLIRLEVDVPETLPVVSCRSRQIQQVLLNLIANACDALNRRYPEGDPDKVIRIAANVHAGENARWMRITVGDQGDGIPREIQDHIFDPFFSTKPRNQGSGMGLSVSHGIARDHGGRLTFQTSPGEGTRFYLDIPLNPGDSGVV